MTATDSIRSSTKDADPSDRLHELVLKSLDDDQAVETVTIPLAGKSSIADHMVIASGRSTRQVASMATKLAEKIKSETGKASAMQLHRIQQLKMNGFGAYVISSVKQLYLNGLIREL